MTRVRFQADADLKQAIVTGTVRKQPNLDFQSANEAGLEGTKDPDVLAIEHEMAECLSRTIAKRCRLSLVSSSFRN